MPATLTHLEMPPEKKQKELRCAHGVASWYCWYNKYPSDGQSIRSCELTDTAGTSHKLYTVEFTNTFKKISVNSFAGYRSLPISLKRTHLNSGQQQHATQVG